MPNMSEDPQGNDYEVRNTSVMERSAGEHTAPPLAACDMTLEQRRKFQWFSADSLCLLFLQALLAFEERQGAVVSKKLTRRQIQRFPTKTFQSAHSAGNTK